MISACGAVIVLAGIFLFTRLVLRSNQKKEIESHIVKQTEISEIIAKETVVSQINEANFNTTQKMIDTSFVKQYDPNSDFAIFNTNDAGPKTL